MAQRFQAGERDGREKMVTSGLACVGDVQGRDGDSGDIVGEDGPHTKREGVVQVHRVGRGPV